VDVQEQIFSLLDFNRISCQCAQCETELTFVTEKFPSIATNARTAEPNFPPSQKSLTCIGYCVSESLIPNSMFMYEHR
jgi:hypothetical protein